MKKILLSVVLIIATNQTNAQITLEHSFPNEELNVYTNSGETYYITQQYANGFEASSIKIYNSDFSLKNEFFPEIPLNHRMYIYNHNELPSSQIISKKVFDLDDKLDIVVFFENDNFSLGNLIRIYNEDGEIVKDFGNNYYKGYDAHPDHFYVFHDNDNNINKLRLFNETTKATEIFKLPSSELKISEVSIAQTLKIYPNPTNSILNIENPKNQKSELQIFNTNGQLVKYERFNQSSNKISVNIENFNKGIYFIKIGDSVAKVIKE